MTPQLVPQARAAHGEAHLTGEQFGELLARFTETAERESTLAEAHLQACEACSAELASLREAITLFREASDAYAEKELRGIPRWKLPRRTVFRQAFVPAYWMVAAAMFLTALLPLQVLRRHALRTTPAVETSVTVSNTASSAQSDEALLEDVNREVSRSVPASMQALDDPTEETTALNSESTDAPSTLRKD
jgi:predicted anti-sigma-YlaC factor YlaD